LSAYFPERSDIAFGFDPDCHFWNDGIAFSFTTTPNTVPGPTTMLLLAHRVSWNVLPAQAPAAKGTRD